MRCRDFAVILTLVVAGHCTGATASLGEVSDPLCLESSSNATSCASSVASPPQTELKSLIQTRRVLDAEARKRLIAFETPDWEVRAGFFLPDHYPVGTHETYSCAEGVAECQFKELHVAQAWCNTVVTCTGVLEHPAPPNPANCAGGYGCFTPRRGAAVHDSNWDHHGGRVFLKPVPPISTPEPTPTLGGPMQPATTVAPPNVCDPPSHPGNSPWTSKGYIVTSQQELDELEGCTTIDGDLQIVFANDIVDLGALRSLTHLNGELLILHCAELRSLEGLEALRSVGYSPSVASITINQCNKITSIQALQGLTDAPQGRVGVTKAISVNGDGVPLIVSCHGFPLRPFSFTKAELDELLEPPLKCD